MWLFEHYLTAKEIWLVIAKKGAFASTISYNEAVEEAIAFVH